MNFFYLIILLLKKNINRIDRENFMVILEVYKSPQSGFFFDYINDETWTRSTIVYTYGSITKKCDVKRESKALYSSPFFFSSNKCGHRSDRSIVFWLYVIVFVQQFLDSISLFSFHCAVFVVVHEIKTALLSDFYKQSSNE
jgi:hypothetical protein